MPLYITYGFEPKQYMPPYITYGFELEQYMPLYITYGFELEQGGGVAFIQLSNHVGVPAPHFILILILYWSAQLGQI